MDDTINPDVLPKSHVKLINYMNNNNGFYIMVYVAFNTSPQLGGLATKPTAIVTDITL